MVPLRLNASPIGMLATRSHQMVGPGLWLPLPRWRRRPYRRSSRGWPHAYDSFADGSYWTFIGHAWRSGLVPNVHVLIPLLAVFEATVGVLILVRTDQTNRHCLCNRLQRCADAVRFWILGLEYPGDRAFGVLLAPRGPRWVRHDPIGLPPVTSTRSPSAEAHGRSSRPIT